MQSYLATCISGTSCPTFDFQKWVCLPHFRHQLPYVRFLEMGVSTLFRHILPNVRFCEHKRAPIYNPIHDEGPRTVDEPVYLAVLAVALTTSKMFICFQNYIFRENYESRKYASRKYASTRKICFYEKNELLREK